MKFDKKRNYSVISLLLLSICAIVGAINIRNAYCASDAFENPGEANNNTFTDASLIEEGWQRELVLELGDIDWFKVKIDQDAEVTASVYYSGADGNLTLEMYQTQDEMVSNSSEANANFQLVNATFMDQENEQEKYAYIKVSGDAGDIPYQLNLNYLTINDDSGFYISDNYLENGYTPNTLMLVLNYIFMGAVILLWIQFGFSFILKGRKDVASSEAQSRYYKGLGAFVISVAVSESTYLLDLFARDITGQRIFTKYNTPETFYSFIEVDYYVLSFILVLVGLTFLMYPMEEYLYAKKRKTFTIAIALCIPAPIIFRIVEINHRSLGMDLSNNSTMDYQLMAAAWILVIIIAGMGLLYLLKLYMDLGRKAPRGSKLRKKSRQIILGLLLWLAAIFSTSGLLKSISSVTSDWGPYSTINVGFTGWFVRNQLYYVMPFIIPILLFSALRLLIVGFTREYA